MGNIIANLFEHILSLFMNKNLETFDSTHLDGEEFSENRVYIKNKKIRNKEPYALTEQKGNIIYLPKNLAKKLKTNLMKIHYCSSCDITLNNEFLLKSHCMLHLHQQYKFDDIIQFKFKKDTTIINCILCDKTMYSHTELARHLQLLSHEKIVKHFSYIDNIHNDLSLTNCCADNLLDNNIFEKNSDIIQNISTQIFCRLCRTSIQESDIYLHIKGTEHCNKERFKIVKKDQKESKIFVLDEFSQNFFTCFICLGKSFNNLVQFSEHINTEEHKYKIRIFNQFFNNQQPNINTIQNSFYCSLCLIHVNECIVKHLPLPTVRKSFMFSHKLYKCMKQIISKHDNADILKTLFNIDFKKNDFQILNENFVKFEGHKYKCSICKFATNDKVYLCNHILEETHQNNLAVAKLKSEKNHTISQPNSLPVDKNISLKSNNFENFSFLQSYKSSLLINDELNELIDFHLNDRNLIRSTYNEMLESKTVDEDSNSKTNIKNIESYLCRCLKPGNKNIYNVCMEDIRLLKKGSDLTVPFDEVESVCIPCRERFFNCYLYDHLHCNAHIENLRIMENVYSQTVVTYENLCEFYLIKYLNNWVFCYACGSHGYVTNEEINSHINSVTHVLKSQFCKTNSEVLYEEMIAILKNQWYYVHYYVCTICENKFDSDFNFIIHLESKEHKKKIAQFSTPMKFDICPVCVTCWYGKWDTYDKHCFTDTHKQFLTSNEFAVPNIPKAVEELLYNVDFNANNFIEESNTTINLHKDIEHELLKFIEENVKYIYQDAKAHILGSVLTNLVIPDSNIDIFLECENNYLYTGSEEQSKVHLITVLNTIEVEETNWITDEVLLKLKVPILKLRHIQTNLKCNISFTNGLGVEKSKLIKYYIVSFPICRELILYIRKWLHLCQLSGSNGISTYAISWFVIFYLQTVNILPSVSDVLTNLNESIIVAGWECPRMNFIPTLTTNYIFKDLLKRFFLYYGTFDYHYKIICPLLGEPIPKYYFADNKKLPIIMQNYKRQVIEKKIESFSFYSPLCIQDPINHSENITKDISKLQLRSFRKYCTESSVLLTRLENNI